jgi:hypothetical protein
MLELLKEVVPAATRVAMLTNPTFQPHAAFGDRESDRVTVPPSLLQRADQLIE